MTIIDKKMAQALFPVTTSSLLKLAHHTMHGGETWYACVFKRFHDDHEQKMASGTCQGCPEDFFDGKKNSAERV